MKKRIIAALTAMVMVVTMIPSSAFAADASVTKERAVELITAAAGLTVDGDTKKYDVPYTEKQMNKVKEARTAYDNLNPSVRDEIEADFVADTKKVSVKDLWVAEAMIKYQANNVSAYNNALAAIVDESLEVDSSDNYVGKINENIAKASKKLGDSMTLSVVVENGQAIVKESDVAGAYVADGNIKKTAITSVDAPKGTIDVNKETVAKAFFGNNFETLDVNAKSLVKAINAITPKIAEEMNVENAAKPPYSDVADKIKDATTVKSEYLRYIKGNKNYQAAKAKVEALDTKEIVKATEALAPYKDARTLANVVASTEEPLVTNKNYALAKKAYDNGVALYNEAEKSALKGHADVVALGQALYGTPDAKANNATKNNIEMYEKAKAVSDFITSANAKSTLTLEDIEKIKGMKDANEFTNTDNFDALDKFVDSEAAAQKRSVKAFNDLVAKMDNQIAGMSDTELFRTYGELISNALSQVPDIEAVSYFNDGEKILNVFDAFIQYGAVTGKDSLDFKVANPKAKADEDMLDRISNTATTNKANLIGAINNLDKGLLEKINVAGKDGKTALKLFIDKCVKVNTNYTDGKTAADNLPKVFENFNKYLDEAHGGVATVKDRSFIANKATEDDVKKAIKKYRDDFAKLTVDGKIIYDAEQKKLADNPKKAKQTDVEKVAALEVALSEYAYSYNNDVVTKANKVEEIVNAKVYNSVAGKPMTESQVASTKAAFAEIDELFKTPGVELLFRGLQGSGNIDHAGAVYSKAIYEANKDYTKYKYGAAIKRYLTAKEELKDVNVSEATTAVINAIEELKLGADLDANLAAFNAVKAQYDALSLAEKEKVTNYNKLVAFAKNITKEAVKVVETEMAKLGFVSDVELSAAQKVTVENVKTLLAKYNDVLVEAGAYDPKAKLADGIDKMFKAPFGVNDTKAAITLYFDALGTLEKTDRADAVTKIAPLYKEMSDAINAKYEVGGLTGFEAEKVATIIDKYNALTAYEKEVFASDLTAELDKINELLGLTTDKFTALNALKAPQINGFLSMEKDAKALVLKYATVEKIEDQAYTGEAITPAVVVKDANGKVIDATKLDITYLNNVELGIAKVVIVPAGTDMAGRLEVEFNIVKGEVLAPVVPTAAKLATDQGIIKVTVAKVDGLTYRFMVRKANTNKWITKNSKTNSAVFTGLVKNTMYEVKVATVLGNEVSEFNNLGFVHTNKLANKPARMYKAIINKVTIKKGVAKVTTKNVAYKNEQYRVGFKKYGTKNFKWNAWGTNTVKTVKGLKKGVKYTFTIQYRYKSAVSGTFVYSNYAKYVVKTAK